MQRGRRKQAGLSIVEALVALGVLALGTAGLMHGQSVLTASSAAARQTLDAVHRLRSAMEVDRGPFVPGRAPDDGQAPDPAAVERSSVGAGVLGTTMYTLRWTDRDGTVRAWTLAAQAAAPDLDRAEFFERPSGGMASAPRGTGARAVGVPPEAVDLDATTSLWSTTAGGVSGWVFDRASGRLVGVCDAPAPAGGAGSTANHGAHEAGTAAGNPTGTTTGTTTGTPTRTATDTEAPTTTPSRTSPPRLPPGCRPIDARVVGGIVRFALGEAPSAEGPFDTPLPLQVGLRDAAGRASAIGSIGCDISVVRSGDPHLAWRCAWPTAAATGPGGHNVRFEPEGWSLDGAGATHRLCRYRDGEVRADAPGWPRWLVVRAAVPCPDGTTAEAAAQSGPLPAVDVAATPTTRAPSERSS
jgi:hypothetical protein